jgi:GPH family glycoside/pentoside/hexuronide:cation symporter
VAVSIATVVSGYVLRFTGFQEGMATQGKATLFWIRFWEIGLPPALCLIGVVLLAKYPLSEERVYEIKKILDDRKAKARGENAPGGHDMVPSGQEALP